MSTFKQLFTDYGVFLGRRYYEKEKLKFLLFLKKDLEKIGFHVDTTQSKQEFLDEKMVYTNLYAGNLQKAKTVIVTYYDTPVYKIVGNRYKPFQIDQSRLSWLNKLIFPIGILLLTGGLFYYLLYPILLREGVWSPYGIASLVFLFIAILLIKRYRGGIPRRQNIVRNTSSIMAMLLYAKKAHKKSDVALAFIDGGAGSNYGSIMLNDKLSKIKTKVIYLDSIISKDPFHIFTKQPLKLNLSNVTQHQMKQEFSQLGDILITSGKYQNNKITVNTKKYGEDIEELEKKLNDFVEILDGLV